MSLSLDVDVPLLTATTSFAELYNLAKTIKRVVNDYISSTELIISNLNSIKVYYEAEWYSDVETSHAHVLQRNSKFDDFHICSQSVQTSLKSAIIGFVINDGWTCFKFRFFRLQSACDISSGDKSEKLNEVLDSTIKDLAQSLDLLKSYQLHVLKGKQDVVSQIQASSSAETNSAPTDPIQFPEPKHIDKSDAHEENQPTVDYEIFEDATDTTNVPDFDTSEELDQVRGSIVSSCNIVCDSGKRRRKLDFRSV